MLKKAIQIRLNDPRIILNELFGYLSFSTGLITAYFVITENHSLYGIFNQIMLASCGLQNIPLLMIYIPQWRVLISTGILGIIVTNYFATNPLGNAFREGLFVGMIKVDYSYEALHKYYPEKYPHESELLANPINKEHNDSSNTKNQRSNNFINRLCKYLGIVIDETFKRSYEMLLEIKKGNFKAFTTDAIRSQFFSSLMRIISATPLFIIAAFELASLAGIFHKTEYYIEVSGLWTTISVRALAFSSFIDGLSKIAFGFMRESIMMRIGGCIFAAAQFHLMLNGPESLRLVIPLSLAGLAAYPIVESERLRKLALEANQ